ncbi:MAG: XRE family transcriptional regulator [Bacteroidales bacterium]|nr:XRE family transcriptional regulator [Bacteroidales bacterium]
MENSEFHIGIRIKEVMEQSGRKVSWLANKLCFSRGNVYKLYQKDNIDIKLLLKISELLEYDFFEDLSKMLKK